MSMTYDDGDVPNLDSVGVAPTKPVETTQPLYRIYEGSRIAVSRQVGKSFKRKMEASLAAHDALYLIMEEIFKYYNNDHTKTQTTQRGVFKRGDGTENVIFSNLNITLPAVYGKDPDINCSTSDEGDEPFCKALEALVNALFRRKDALKAKTKIKKATGTALLTNTGILKLDFTSKDDSRELAINEMTRITDELADAKTQEDIDRLYGELEALEMNMEVMKPSGFSLGQILPHNLIIDAYAEEPDGTDAEWQMERCYLPTGALNARYTKPEDESDEGNKNRVLVYAPTHKAQFTIGGAGERDDGLGVVMQAIDGKGNLPTSFTNDERTAYIEMYFTECYKVWDRVTRRVYLFHRDDWTWPLWVWDDPLKITRFFPHFIISFDHSTGGTFSAGATAYVLDHQDEINDINRQKSKIRRAIFDFFYYNSEKIDSQEAEKFVKGLRGEGSADKHLLGIKAGETALKDVIEAVAPPAAHYDTLFDTKPILDSINRITNTSDAIRGVQFHTNTNVAAVQSYEQSLRLSIGSKVDVVEDVVADIAGAVAEIAIQNWDIEVVTGYIGPKLAQGWQMMDLDTFRSTYSLDIASGSMEKPNSVFKKKEAIEVSQAIGQFAQAAPGATLRIMLNVLSQAFTEIVIKPEDWAAIDQEIQANLTKGVSTGSGGGASGQPTQTGQTQQGQQPDSAQLVKQMDPRVKARVVQMHQQGVPEPQIVQFIQQQLANKGQGNDSAQPKPGQ